MSGKNNDDGWDAAEEERILRTLKKKESVAAGTIVPRRMPSSSSVPTSLATVTSPRANPELETLVKQRKNVLGMITTANRELTKIREELQALRQREADLVAQQEKRQTLADELQEKIAVLEEAAQHQEKASNEAAELEKQRQREEYERRQAEERERIRLAAEGRPSGADASSISTGSAFTSPRIEDDESRILRTIERGGRPAGNVSSFASRFNAAAEADAVDSAEKERRLAAEREREEKRLQREREILQKRHLEEEESRRQLEREEAERAVLEQAASTRAQQDEYIQSLKNRPGKLTQFMYKDSYDFDAVCFLVGSFTNWEKVPMERGPDSLDFELTLPLETDTTHLYYFEVDGSREIDKIKPTGFGNGVLCNKIVL